MSVGMLGDIANLFTGQGGGWNEPGLEYRNTTGAAQQNLMQPISQFYQGKLNSSPMDFLSSDFGQQYFNSLLGPSFHDFINHGIPAINDQFSGINGIFNTRRGQAITQGLSSLYSNAQSQYVQAVPSLFNMQFLPGDKASAFATAQTQQTATRPEGSFKQTLSNFIGGI